MQKYMHRVTTAHHSFSLLKKRLGFGFLFFFSVAAFASEPVASKAITKSAPTALVRPELAKIPDELKGATIEEKLGAQVNTDGLMFTDESGQKVAFSSFLRRGFKPIVLNFVYFKCPNLCGYFLNGLLDTLKGMDWTAGGRFEVVTISINPREDAELAAGKKAAFMKVYGRPEAAAGWHFLTGDETTIKQLASQVGFGYRYDEKQKEYAHSAAAIVLTPEGKISRYLYGISFAPKDLKLALLEASSGKIGSVMDRVFLFCYHYDPNSRSYSLAVMRIMQAGSAGSVFMVAGYLMVFWRRQRRPSREV